MSNKLIFRIVGALACAMIIVSVFVPYVSVAGNTDSLWNSYQTLNSLYLPIMIIVFGVIGVIFFALNIKTEFAYMTTGAISFFLVMQTILYIDFFASLSLGYYLQGAGAILTGIMAFLCNLKQKAKVVEQQTIEQTNEPSMLDQIDKLYNDQQTIEQIETIQPIDEIVQPLPVEPLQSIQTEQPIQPINPISVEQPVVQEVQPQPTPEPMPVVQEVQPQPMPEPMPVVQEVQPQPTPEPMPVVQEVQPQPTPVQESQIQSVVEQKPINPVLQEFNFEPVNTQSTPVQMEISQQQPVNPVLQEFNFDNSNTQPQQQIQNATNIDSTPQPTEETQTLESITLEPLNLANTTNPVIQDFVNPSASAPNNNQNNNSLDIFG